jgi:hypothetical protein
MSSVALILCQPRAWLWCGDGSEPLIALCGRMTNRVSISPNELDRWSVLARDTSAHAPMHFPPTIVDPATEFLVALIEFESNTLQEACETCGVSASPSGSTKHLALVDALRPTASCAIWSNLANSPHQLPATLHLHLWQSYAKLAPICSLCCVLDHSVAKDIGALNYMQHMNVYMRKLPFLLQESLVVVEDERAVMTLCYWLMFPPSVVDATNQATSNQLAQYLIRYGTDLSYPIVSTIRVCVCVCVCVCVLITDYQ